MSITGYGSGATGATGAQGVGFTARGVWSPSATYAALDIVSRSGRAYMALTNSTNVDPASESGSVIPDTPVPAGDFSPGPYSLGHVFTTASTVSLLGARFWKAPGEAGSHAINLWDHLGNLIASATVGNETASGWQRQDFLTPVLIEPGQFYVISYETHGLCSATNNALPSYGGPINMSASVASTNLGVTPYPENLRSYSFFVDLFYSVSSFWGVIGAAT